jgi:hypothetical protein
MKTRVASAIERISNTFDISEKRASELAGIDYESIKNWIDAPSEHALAALRQLFEIDAVIVGLEKTLGLEAMLVWLRGTGENGQARQQTLSEPGGAARISREASPLLFPTKKLIGMLPTPAELDDDMLLTSEQLI